MAGPKFKLDVLITAIDRFTGPVRLINQRISRLARPVTAVSNRLTSLGRAAGIDVLAQRFRAVGSALGGVNTALWTAGRRVVGVTAAAGGLAYLFKRQFIDTADTFERLELSLEAIEGSAERARQSMGFIKRLTVETPFETKDIADTFRMMRAFGMDPTDGSLQSIVDQVSKIGGVGDDLTGIALQLGQAWSKGRLQAQDTRIMIERGLPVWGMLERATERTGKKIPVAQLRKLSEDGKLGLGAIRLLIEQMGIESAGASKRMMTTWTGIISNLKDQWTFFKLKVMESGPFERLKSLVQGILDRVNRMAANGELAAWADRIAVKLERAFTWVRDNGPRILSDIVTNLKGLFEFVDKIAVGFGGWGNLVTLGIAAYIAGPLVASVFSLIAAIAALNLALGGTPAGLLLLAGAGALLGVGFIASKLAKFPAAREESTGPRLLPHMQQERDAQATRFGGLPFTINPGAIEPQPRGPARFDVPVTVNPQVAAFPVAPAPFGVPSRSESPRPPAAKAQPTLARPLIPPGAVPFKIDPQLTRSDILPRGPIPFRLNPELASLPNVAAPLRLNPIPSAAPVNAAGIRPSSPGAPVRDKADINVTVAGPRGTKAEIAPNSTADVSLRTRVNMGLLMPEAN